MIAVVNYGVGNVKSVLCALRRVGEEGVLSSSRAQIEAVAGLILPGVGAFSSAMESLRRARLDDVLRGLAEADRPILGICLGLQLLFTESEEYGRRQGLDLLPGRVRRFASGLKVPHMGWNQVKQEKASPLFDGIADHSFVYFAHSYCVDAHDAATVLGTTDYNGSFASVVGRGNVLGVQFHPEKSGPCGLAMLANFCRACEEG